MDDKQERRRARGGARGGARGRARWLLGWLKQRVAPHDGDNMKKGDKLRWIWDLESRTVLHEGAQEDKNPPCQVLQPG